VFLEGCGTEIGHLIILVFSLSRVVVHCVCHTPGWSHPCQPGTLLGCFIFARICLTCYLTKIVGHSSDSGIYLLF
jgi:hypothetical protein